MSDLLENYLKKHPQPRYLDLFHNDLSNVIRGKRYPFSHAAKVLQNGLMLPGSAFLLSVTGESLDPEGKGFSDGDPDEHGRIIEHTLSPQTWSKQPTVQAMITLESLSGVRYPNDPRNVLHKVLSRFAELELRPVVAFELEFYLFDPKPKKGQLRPPKSPLTGLRSGSTQVYSLAELDDFEVFLDDVVSSCAIQGLDTAAMTAEYAPGQFEINLNHSDDPLRAADHAVMFRRTVQCVARQHNMRASFMAKPYADQAGSGLHLHLSLLDKDGNNVFDGGGDFGSDDCMSATMRHAIGGLQATYADSMSIFAPNANSYQRYAVNNYVPVNASWGMENRSVAFRVPKSAGNARRIEHRLAGADANPYLALAALLSGVHHGISQQIQPTAAAQGNAGSQLGEGLPFDIVSAAALTRDSSLLAPYFGAEYLKIYGSAKQLEYEAFSAEPRALTDWYL